MDDHTYGVDSRILEDLKAENLELDDLIARCRDLIHRTETLLSSTAAQLEEETGKPSPMAQWRSRKQQ